MEPSYRRASREGLLKDKVAEARRLLEHCSACPRCCGVNRLRGEAGFCRIGRAARVASFGPHFGEEDVLVGRYGSGTVFFSGCNLRCVFCQNADISAFDEGQEVGAEELAGIMMSLQRNRCHNINLVSPSHQVPQIIEALHIAAARGLSIPIVYNTGGYDSTAVIDLLDGLVDIYMPDIKYSDEAVAGRLSAAPDYPSVVRAAVRIMHEQVGDLVVDSDGVAVRGLIVRHLVLPGGLAGTAGVMRFIAEEISRNTYINIMAQYHPAHRAHQYPPLEKPLEPKEHEEALAIARSFGLWRFAR